MPSIINTNMSSLIAQRQLNKSQMSNQTAMTRLSSGLRINSAKDDAAGQAISERLTAQVRGFNQAARNANDGTSLAQVTENGLGEVGNLLQRLREIAVQSTSDTNSLGDRQALDSEAKELIAEVNNISQTTQFNGKGVLNGDTNNFDFQVGAYAGQMIRVSSVDARAGYLGGNMVRGQAIRLDTTDGTKNFKVGDFGSVTVGGVTINLDGSAGAKKATSIDDVVAAVNEISESTGVTALRSSRAVVDMTTAFGDAATAATFTDGTQFNINGVKVTIAMPATADTAAKQNQVVMDAINNVADKTGVRAESSDLAADSFQLVSNGDIVMSNVADATGNLGTIVANQGTYFRGINFMSKTQEGSANALGATSTIDVSLAMGADTDVGKLNALINSNTVKDESGNAVVRDFTIQNLNVSYKQGAEQAIDTLDFAINQVNGMRGKMGALQNRFQSTVNNLQSMSENITAARSRIQDADFAAETAELSRTQVLQQAGTAMLSQANASSQNVLSLLR